MTSSSPEEERPVPPSRTPLSPLSPRTKKLIAIQLDKRDADVGIMRPHMMRGIPTIIEPPKEVEDGTPAPEPPVAGTAGNPAS